MPITKIQRHRFQTLVKLVDFVPSGSILPRSLPFSQQCYIAAPQIAALDIVLISIYIPDT